MARVDNRRAADDTEDIGLLFREEPAVLLHDLTIENFRSFEKYKLDKLARVNLLVGDNNCGKTSVLDAVHIFIANGRLSCTLETLQIRESISGRRRNSAGREEDVPDITALVHQNSSSHDDTELRSFTLLESEGKSVTIKIVFEDEIPAEIQSIAAYKGEMFRRQHERIDARKPPSVPQVPQGKPPFDKPTAARLNHIPPHVFVPARGLSSARIARFWTDILKSRNEKFVEDAMSLVDERIEKIIVTPEARTRSNILFDRGDERVSAAQVGEGTAFLFSISIAIATSHLGVALIDEIDTGLHYSRLADMWKMVITAAQKLDVQVFATTHSLDCIRGLAEAVRNDESFVDDVAIFKIDRRTDHAVRYSGDELEIIVDHEIEVRG